jgi:hypothetical protein
MSGLTSGQPSGSVAWPTGLRARGGHEEATVDLFAGTRRHRMRATIGSRDRHLWYNVEHRCFAIEERSPAPAVFGQRDVTSLG